MEIQQHLYLDLSKYVMVQNYCVYVCMCVYGLTFLHERRVILTFGVNFNRDPMGFIDCTVHDALNSIYQYWEEPFAINSVMFTFSE